MRNALTIAGKELRSYFSSPIGWVVMGLFALLFGYFFMAHLYYFVETSMQAQQGGGPVNVNQFMIRPLLQNVALLIDVRDDTIGEPAASVASLNRAVTVWGVEVRKVTIVAVVVAVVALGLLALLLTRTRIGLQMRAAATDFGTARLLGVRANTVIAVAVLLSALLAGAVAVILTVQNPLVSPDFALKDTIIVLVGVVVGGIDRLWTAMLGGFSIGFATGVINGALPTDKTVFLPSVVFLLVIAVLLVRPDGLFARGRTGAVERL